MPFATNSFNCSRLERAVTHPRGRHAPVRCGAHATSFVAPRGTPWITLGRSRIACEKDAIGRGALERSQLPMDRIEWLVRIGIIKPRAPGRVGAGDLFRAR